jgi:thioredoxin-related protein
MKNTADCDQLKLDVAQYELITEAISKYIKTLLLIVDDTKLTKFNDQLEEIDQLINKYIGSPQPVVPVTTGSSVVSTTGTGP